ncbi:MAG: hypothetical protein K8I30_20595, partial [Anaerolineae bacterium]|nr:hypothetical protein [Anaerolineae bacterium]
MMRINALLIILVCLTACQQTLVSSADLAASPVPSTPSEFATAPARDARALPSLTPQPVDDPLILNIPAASPV